MNKHATTIRTTKTKTIVQLYETQIITLDHAKGTITLNCGKYPTQTTKRRMNDFSKENSLGYNVYSRRGKMLCDHRGTTYKFDKNNKVTLELPND